MPASMMTIAITQAKIGRWIKKDAIVKFSSG
jgi:arginine repressor